MKKAVKSSFSQSDNHFLKRLKDGNEKAFEEIYELYETQFCQWALKKFNLKESEVFDAFQEAVMGVYLNLQEGKLKELTSDFQTYLFGIAKNLLLKKIGIEGRYYLLDDFSENDFGKEIEEKVPEDDQEEQARILLGKAGEPCKSILKSYYILNKSMANIASELGYKSADVVKAQKVRCVNYLKKLMKK